MDDGPLLEALASSQRLGMLGSRPITEVVDHADAFVGALEPGPGLVVDLGSGGGVPGLVIAWRRPDLEVALVDRRATRTDHLRRLVGRLDLAERVSVWSLDAAELPAHLGGRRADAVVARGFGPPLRTAAAAAPLLRPGGRLVVSEPPEGGSSAARWPTSELRALGLEAVAHADSRVVVLAAVPRETSG